MKKYAIYLLVLLWIAIQTIAVIGNTNAATTGKISGVVYDKKTKEPIAGAIVMVEGTSMGAQTGPDGKYIIINVSPRSYNLIASNIGYIKVKVEKLTVTVNHTTIQDFWLEASTVILETQIVRAERDILQLGTTTNQVQLSADGIQNMPVTNVQDLVKAQAGVVDRNSKLHIRGGRSYGATCLASAMNISGNAVNDMQIIRLPHGGTTPVNGADFYGMFFKNYGVNPFIDTDDDRLSTFAIDCDNAAYAMTRSYLNRGAIPPNEAVRVEEFVNNFKYSYQHPQEQAFTIQLEGAPSKFGGKNYHLLKVGIVGKKISTENRKDANLVFVVDVSGSMRIESRLGMVRRSLRMLVDNLTTRDRVGIVAYGSTSRIILEPTSVNERDKIINAIEQLVAGGATNCEAGVRMGYQMAERSFIKGVINRIILCSDGVANVGRTGPDELLKHIKKYADKGITLTSVGFGMNNYNDVLMEKLGDKGNGHYAYVDNWDEAKRIFLENLTGTLQVIARDVKIQVDFDPNVVVRYRLLGYENRDVADAKFRDDKEDGGEIGSGHQVTALYEVKFRENAKGDLGVIYVRYKDPETFEVTEVSQKLKRSVFKGRFNDTSANFRLAATAAEFAEIMRHSYWAKGSELSNVLAVARMIEQENESTEVLELMNLIAQADKLITAKEGGTTLGQR